MATEKNIFSELPPGRSRELLFSVLQQEHFVGEKFNYKIQKVIASRWFSSLYMIEVNNPTNKLCIYLKCLPENAKKREMMRSSLNFQNEVTFYNMILPALQKLQREMCPQLSSPISVPQCYAAEWNGKDDVVILENMSRNGFVLLDRRRTMTLPEMSLVMKELGRFHGFSLVMKILLPEEMKRIEENLIEPIFVNPQFEEIFGPMFYNNLIDIRTVMKECYEENSIYVKAFQNFLTKILDLLPIQARVDQSNEPYNVITHGDLWINNFLFHYGEDRSEPDDICFLDFQQIRYNSPALDLGRFLYGNMEKAMREEYRDDLLRCYYDNLGDTLRQYGLVPETLLPFNELESQLSKYSAYVLNVSLLNIVHALDDHEEEEEYNGDEVESMLDSVRKTQQRMSAACCRRVFDVIEEFVDRGYMGSDCVKIMCN